MKNAPQRLALLAVAVIANSALAQGVPGAADGASQSSSPSVESSAAPQAALKKQQEPLPATTAPVSNAAEPSVPPEYETQLRLGLKELEAGRLAEARTRFMMANKAFETARTLLSLGQVAFEMKDYPAAVRYLEGALASQVKPIPEDKRQEVRTYLEVARGYVARFRVKAEPETAKVLVDSAEANFAPDGTLLLGVGPHTVEAQAEGFMSARRTLNVLGGQHGEIRLALVPLVVQKQTEASEDGAIYEEWWFWTSVGGVVAAAVVSGVLVANAEPNVVDATGGSTGAIIRVPAN